MVCANQSAEQIRSGQELRKIVLLNILLFQNLKLSWTTGKVSLNIIFWVLKFESCVNFILKSETIELLVRRRYCIIQGLRYSVKCEDDPILQFLMITEHI